MRHFIQFLRVTVVTVSFLFSTVLLAETLPLPPTNPDFVSTHFSGSANCGACHNQLFDAEGTDVSLENDWKTTMMANASRDPLWQAKVASEMKRNPHLGKHIGNICARCHTPMASVEAEADGLDLDIFKNGLLDPNHLEFDAAMDGVSCTLCHQIEDDGQLGTEAGASGGFSVNLSERLAYGPKVLPRINPMRNESGFTPTHGAHLSGSEVCGSCHDLKTAFVDGEGNVVDFEAAHGGFPEQMVYTEWENSAYAPGRKLDKSCQDCHMPESDGVKLANRPRWLSPEDNFSRHSFLGANTVLMEIIDANSEELGATSADFAPAIQRSRDNLASAAELKVRKGKIVNGRLKVWLGVHNLSGHKLPSGYPSRRVYIHLVVKDALGGIVFESGRANDDGSIVGVDADQDPHTFEPHHKFITKSDQVQVYEAIMGNTDGQVTHTLLEASHYLKDNRLPPAGFNKAEVPDEIAVHGVAENDKNFNYAWDIVKYSIKLPQGDAGEVFTVEAELNYQTLSHAYLANLFLDVDEPAVARFKRMYDQSEIRVETITRTSFTVTR